MKEIKRDVYLNKIIEKRENGLIKIITGIKVEDFESVLKGF